MVWNEETIRQLKDLWVEGHSTAEIGRRLGVSKNAIVGKAHRLDLEARPSPIRREAVRPESERQPQVQRTNAPTLPPLASASASVTASAPHVPPVLTNVQPLRRPPEPAPVVTPAATAPRPVPVPLARPVQPVSVRRSAPSCCWPIGEPGTRGFRFCDGASLPGKPYCDEHAKLAYVRIKDRKEDAA